MAATVCPAPQFVGLDNSGNPLSGGKLYSYSAGTTAQIIEGPAPVGAHLAACWEIDSVLAS